MGNRDYFTLLISVVVLGVSVYFSSLLVLKSLSTSISVSLDELFVVVFYINTINLLYIVFLAYTYTRYRGIFIRLLAFFVRSLGRVDRYYSSRVSEAVYEWSIRNAGLTTGVIVVTIFLGSLWKTKLLLGFPYPLTYVVLHLIFLPHTLIELIAFYIALWGTIKMHYRGSLIAGIGVTSTLMLLAAAILEAYVSPVLLNLYMK